MRCPRCHSENIVQIGHLVYCRNCISFGQVRPNSQSREIPVESAEANVHYELGYDLSHKQKEIAMGVIKALQNGQNVVIEAVCGSGKTELVYPCIIDALRNRKTVGFCLPRRDLAIEIYERLHQQLKGVKMCLVYGGHHEDCFQTLVVCTTHQLHRYWQYFDLLIIDEVDAFPFYRNELLNQLAVSSCKGQFVLMSATAFENEEMLPKQFAKFTLHRRYHGYDMPLPHLKWCPDSLFILWVYPQLKRLIQKNSLCLIYVPIKKDIEKIVISLQRLGIACDGVSSGHPNPQEPIAKFRNHEIDVLVTTTLLERGVTFKDVHVFVYRAHHQIFNTATLIQIAGRVGRKPDYPSGEVYFVGHPITKEMKACRRHIKKQNAA